MVSDVTGDQFIGALMQRLGQIEVPVVTGKVQAAFESVLEAVLPGASVGSLVQVGNAGVAQVARVEQNMCKLTPLNLPDSPGVGTPVRVLAREPYIFVGPELIGRVISPLGIPMDQKGPLNGTTHWSIHRAAPHPFDRPGVNRQLITGIKAIDAVLCLGEGGRIGLFAGPGQGKSTLIGMLARGCECDVAVICLAGERGREAGEFVRHTLGTRGLEKSVVVLATSDAAAAQRVMAIQSATAIAEWFRDQGKRVLLLVDSLTRVVRAKRDLDLALGSPVGPGGLAATTLSFLPGVLERAAPNALGSISAVYTVLSETQSDELISSEITSLLDGHILLSKKRADAGKWPAIDVVKSISRVMRGVTSETHREMAARLRSVLAAYEENEELMLMGAYTPGSCPLTDTYIRCRREIDAFLAQSDTAIDFAETVAWLTGLIGEFDYQR